jgi:hypothetical protein
MRIAFVASALSVLALVGFGASSEPASAAKTKLGCERGKQVWNATLAKCEAGKSKYTRVASKAPKKAAAKKEMKKEMKKDAK